MVEASPSFTAEMLPQATSDIELTVAILRDNQSRQRTVYWEEELPSLNVYPSCR